MTGFAPTTVNALGVTRSKATLQIHWAAEDDVLTFLAPFRLLRATSWKQPLEAQRTLIPVSEQDRPAVWMDRESEVTDQS